MGWLRCFGKRRLHLRLDLDGVVYDLVRELLPLLTELMGKPVQKEHIVEFHIPRALGLPITNRDLFDKVAEQGLYWSATEPMPMVKKYVNRILEEGHEVTLVTSRPRRVYVSGRTIDVETGTRDWVCHHFGGLLTVEVLGENPDELVEKVAAEHEAHFLVDDDPAALLRLGRLRDKTLPVAFDQPWNRSWAGDRVYDWADLYDFIKRESSRLRSILE